MTLQREREIVFILLAEPEVAVELLDMKVEKYVEHPVISQIVNFAKKFFNKFTRIPPPEVFAQEFPEQIDFLSDILEDEVDTDYALSQIESEIKKLKIKELIFTLSQKIDDPKVDPESLWEKGREILQLRTGVKEDIDYFEEGFPRKYTERDVDVIKTGIKPLDDVLKGGMRRGWLGVLAGGSGLGKSSILINFCVNAVYMGKKALYITLEMDKDEVLKRIDMRVSGLTADELMDDKNLILLEKRISEMRKLGGDLRIAYSPPATLSVARLSSLIDKYEIMGFVPDVVFVDYGDLLLPLERKKDRWSEVAEIFNYLKKIATSYKMAIWTATQIGKSNMYVKQATLDKVYGSSEKSFIADLVLTISNTKEEASLGSMRLFVAKFRHGRSHIDIPVVFEKERMLISALTP